MTYLTQFFLPFDAIFPNKSGHTGNGVVVVVVVG